MSRLVLCADDFGLTDGISEAILALAGVHKLNATSCMVDASACARHAPALLSMPHMAIGLHLVLGAEPMMGRAGMSLPAPSAVERAAALGTLNSRRFAAAIDAQFVRFRALFGRAPDFVDGHRNAHVLPGIRALVVTAMRRHAPAAWLRSCEDGLAAMLARPFRGKAMASALWSAGLTELAARAGIATNDSFAGHYDFASDYAALLPRFLNAPGAFHLVMCHPGGRPHADDPLGDARRREALCLARADVVPSSARRHRVSIPATEALHLA